MTDSITLLFPHQLFENHSSLDRTRPIYLVEEYLFFREFNFHKQKLAYHRASMKAYHHRLLNKGFEVVYVPITSSESDIRLLITNLSKQGVQHIHFINPTDNWLESRMTKALSREHMLFTEYENPIFINTRDELAEYFKPGKKKFFQTAFYQQQRQKRGILIEHDGAPMGGKWSFDTENRKKYPPKRLPPSVQFPPGDNFWKEAMQYIQEHFPDNPGELSHSPIYPYTPEDCMDWLERFFQFRFHDFGEFEDAIVKDQMILHHSVLTPMMNVGLLSPIDIIKRCIAFSSQYNIPMNSTEGFVRQILGWREFIRGMYETCGTFSRTKNYWGFTRKIPSSFYDGTTGIPPIDQTIKKLLKTGYNHHIERLMVLGNFMLLCEFDPDEVYRWFMEMYIDAYDWVMVPNIYGMSQFSDGGTFATKPYISGSNYLMKMSDFPKGDWQKTWDALFWRFMHIHRDFFLKNPRLSMLVRSFDKMTEDKKQAHLDEANRFLSSLNI